MNVKTPSTPSEVINSTPERVQKNSRTPVRAKNTRKSHQESTEETALLSKSDISVTQQPSKARKSTTRRRKAEPSDSEATAESEERVETPPVIEEKVQKRRTRRKKTTETEEALSSITVQQDAAQATAVKAPKKRGRPKKAVPKTTLTEEGPEKAEAPEDAMESTSQEAPQAENTEPPLPANSGEIASSTLQEIAHEEDETTPHFTDLGLSEPILRAVHDMGYTHPTPIQAHTIPDILAGHDILGVAQTGTGKTASFTLPLLEKLSTSRARARMPRSLILEPTRELALQVAENFERYGKYLTLSHALLIGGNSMNEQRDLLNRGVDVLIATPGRLLDLFKRDGLLLTRTDLLVIDEADRMLDMGFIPDIERIVQLLPRHRQTLFFSATMAPEIRRLADAFLNHPKEVTVTRQSSVASTISEWIFRLNRADKQHALRTLLQTENVQNAIIFCNRKRDVDTLQAYLLRNHFATGHLHGDLNQSLRFETLERFRSGELKILVCSDVAARGIDISGLSHVFNYDLPFNAEDYIHRIGRTGRAGNEGCAFSFVAPDERNLLEAIEHLTRKPIEQAVIEGFASPAWTDEQAKANDTPTHHTAQQSDESHGHKIQRHDHRSDALRGNHLPLDKNGFLPAVSEKEGPQYGFGDYVPSFMQVAFPPQLRSFPVA